jgi:hypothetical protein
MASLTYRDAWNAYASLRIERQPWEHEWQQISNFLLPGRGIYHIYSRKKQLKLVSPAILNDAGGDALGTLVSGFHSQLTTETRPWFKLDWMDNDLKQIPFLVQWLEECDVRLHKALHSSNFYTLINNFYREYGGFNTATMYVGEDSEVISAPFRFEVLTTGEYAIANNTAHMVDTMYRTIFRTPRQVVEMFDKARVSKATKERAKSADANIPDVALLEVVRPEKFSDKAFTQYFFEVSIGASLANSRIAATRVDDPAHKPLQVRGFYEFPYMVARWETIGSDTYGIGPGFKALNDIKRLQEHERVVTMGVHREADPPLVLPAAMEGSLKKHPGGENYMLNTEQKASKLYDFKFDLPSVIMSIERLEDKIGKKFFNEVFIASARDPNASPLRTGQVNQINEEKNSKLDPITSRLGHEFFRPLINRCFNICLRKDIFPILPPEYHEIVGSYKIELISPLALAQRMASIASLNYFTAFLGQTAQFDPTVVDIYNTEESAREAALVTGVPSRLIHSSEEVKAIRKQREAAMAQQQQQEQQQMDNETAATQSTTNLQSAQERKLAAEAAEATAKTQATIPLV